MMIFPVSPAPSNVIVSTLSYDVLVTTTNTNKEQRRLRNLRPKRLFTLQYQGLTQVNISILEGFYNSCKGLYTSFIFILPVPGDYKGEFVAKQTGSEVNFDLPCVNTSNLKVYVDGIETSVTLNAGVGVDGRDRITFASAPAIDSLIVADFTGNLVVNARFNKEFSKSINPTWYDADIELVEVI